MKVTLSFSPEFGALLGQANLDIAPKYLPNPKKHSEQAALIRWWDYYAPREAQKLLFAIPNGGARSARTGALLKAEGVRAGVPDLFLAIASSGYHGMFIEMKKQRNSRLSDAQQELIPQLEAQGIW